MLISPRAWGFFSVFPRSPTGILPWETKNMCEQGSGRNRGKQVTPLCQLLFAFRRGFLDYFKAVKPKPPAQPDTCPLCAEPRPAPENTNWANSFWGLLLAPPWSLGNEKQVTQKTLRVEVCNKLGFVLHWGILNGWLNHPSRSGVRLTLRPLPCAGLTHGQVNCCEQF